jgi:hypothetical protein
VLVGAGPLARRRSKAGHLARTRLFKPSWIQLAAARTFAIMALLTGIPSGGPAETLCLVEPHVAPLSRMGVMYLLMSAFHLVPWLNLICRRQSPAP